MNVLAYMAAEQAAWDSFTEDMGYNRITTFYGDLSVAECFGLNNIRESYNSIMKEWLGNVEYITEFIMCLNHKIWEFYEGKQLLNCGLEKSKSIAQLYDELWNDAVQKFFERYKDDEDAKEYYYRVTD